MLDFSPSWSDFWRASMGREVCFPSAHQLPGPSSPWAWHCLSHSQLPSRFAVTLILPSRCGHLSQGGRPALQERCWRKKNGRDEGDATVASQARTSAAVCVLAVWCSTAGWGQLQESYLLDVSPGSLAHCRCDLGEDFISISPSFFLCKPSEITVTNLYEIKRLSVQCTGYHAYWIASVQ